MNRDWIAQWAMYSPNKIVISEYGTNRSVTYGQLDALGNSIAAWFESIGVRKGARVAVLAENCLEHFFLFAAAQKSGIIIVPLNYRLSAPEVDYLLNDCTPQVVIVQDKFQQMVESCPQYASVPHRFSLEEFASKQVSGDKNQSTITKHEVPSIEEHDPLLILYTSGTTGFPKGAIYTHGMAFWNAINTAMRLNLTEHDHTVIFLPLFHTGGWNVFATPFLHFGASFVLMTSFSAEAILEVLEAEKMTVLMGVPTTLKMLVASPKFADVRLDTLRYCVVGGEPMPVPLIEVWHTKGIAIRQGFGMTETGPNLFSLHQDDATRKIGSIGLPNFYVQTRVVDDDGNEVSRGDSGELWIRGPMNTLGYWNNPKATAENITDGWLHTGDIVRQDEEGYFFVMDRKKNMYISGGENVYPAEVEKFLHTHPAVAEAAIIGVADERWGEVGKAFVVLKPGMTASAEEILAFCQGNLAKFKIPRSVSFLPVLPKNDAGKINRIALRST